MLEMSLYHSPYHLYYMWLTAAGFMLCSLLQACRGGRFDYGVELESTDAANAPEVSPTEMKEMVEQQVTVSVCSPLESLEST